MAPGDPSIAEVSDDTEAALVGEKKTGRSGFHMPLMMSVESFALAGQDFSGDAADSDAEEGTGGGPPGAAPRRASTPAVSGVY